MRIIVALFAVLSSLCSCSKYQYLKVSSDNMRQNQTNEFIAENDSFRVVYKFLGEDGPLQIAVVNKSVTDLQVDWSKSWFINKKGKYRSLYTPGKTIKNFNDQEESGPPSVISSAYEIISPLHTPELVMKNNSVNKVSISLFSKGFMKSRGGKKQKEHILLADMTMRAIKRFGFTSRSSPFRFRLQLTMAVPGKPEQPIVLNNSFYISELVATRAAPQHLPELADRVMVEKPTFSGAVLKTIGTVVVVGVVFIVKGWLDSLEDDN